MSPTSPENSAAFITMLKKGQFSISKPVDFLTYPRIAFQEKLPGVKLASLRMPALRHFGSFDALLPQREMFIETYLENSKVERNNIHIFESASLLTSAGNAFRLQRSNWKEAVLVLVEESENALQKGRK